MQSVTASRAVSLTVEVEYCIWSKQQSLQKGSAKYSLCALGSGHMYEPQHVCLH